ncbi:hypothetical protein T08_7748 [Trichinella sp. T8]|nr:hypothetical protein T08_7748 [Trichinella sp. T8]
MHNVNALSRLPDVIRQRFPVVPLQRPHLDVQRQLQLSAKHCYGRCYTSALVDATVVRQHDEREHFIPLLLILFPYNGQQIQECATESFSLSVPFQMVRGGPCLFDVEKMAQLLDNPHFER